MFLSFYNFYSPNYRETRDTLSQFCERLLKKERKKKKKKKKKTAITMQGYFLFFVLCTKPKAAVVQGKRKKEFLEIAHPRKPLLGIKRE